eukprot:TRINITY_DN6807_c0_g3_i1.p1 TRINITY_DN6807_c0_g3~~TRINITY_DN6807_c0_g3_i1.p1  ORF type:complete len:474 (-),score=59.28 TRINITY_DN6807_c0_g3_i1:188-1609(-)
MEDSNHISISGYVKKLSYGKNNPIISRVGLLWQKRWLSLSKDTLCYYENSRSQTPKGQIRLEAGCQVRLVNVGEDISASAMHQNSNRDKPANRIKKDHCFKVELQGRAFYFYGNSKIETDTWINTINHNIRCLTQEKSSSNATKISFVPKLRPLSLQQSGSHRRLSQQARLTQSNNDVENHGTWYQVSKKNDEALWPPCRTDAFLGTYKNDILLFGGVGKNGQPDSDLWIFTTDTETWNLVKTSSQAPSSRIAPACSVVKDKFYVFGGASPTLTAKKLNDMWSFDLERQIWERVACKGDIPSARSNSTTAVYKNKIYLYGGTGSDANNLKVPKLNDLYEYDTGNKTWTRLPTKVDMNGHCYHSMTLRLSYRDGSDSASLLVFGGTQYEPSNDSTPLNLITSVSFYEYEIDYGAWKKLPNGPSLIKHSAATNSSGTSMFVWGGISFVTTPSSDLFEYNFAIRTRGLETTSSNWN